MDLSNVDFGGSTLHRVSLKESKCVDATFTGAKLSFVLFEGNVMARAQFGGCTVENCHFDDGKLNHCVFDGSTMDTVSFRATDLYSSSFVGCSFEGDLDFHDALITSVDFTKADLSGIMLCSFQVENL